MIRCITFTPAAGAAALWLLSALPAGALCPGDCDGDGQVLVSELVTAVGVALGGRPLADCLPADIGGDGVIGIAELVAAVTSVLAGCPADPTPTAPAPTVPTTVAATPNPQPPTATVVPPTSTSTAVPSSATPGPPSTATLVPATPTSTAVPSTPTPTPSPTPAANQDPPTRGRQLRDWLEAGNYLDWVAESAPHPSSGPHFGIVRVFVNDRLLDSLERGLVSHPSGAAAVKELYGSGSEILGWSVMVKVEDDSDEGRGWYWYERFNTTTFANGMGVRLCSGCHSTGRDFIRIPFPLQ
jgi:hypothetical protein